MIGILALCRTNFVPNAVYEVTIGGIASEPRVPCPPRACAAAPGVLRCSSATSLEIVVHLQPVFADKHYQLIPPLVNGNSMKNEQLLPGGGRRGHGLESSVVRV